LPRRLDDRIDGFQAAFARLVGPLARLIQSRAPAPALIEALVEDVTASFAPWQNSTGVHIPATLHYVTALRP